MNIQALPQQTAASPPGDSDHMHELEDQLMEVEALCSLIQVFQDDHAQAPLTQAGDYVPGMNYLVRRLDKEMNRLRVRYNAAFAKHCQLLKAARTASSAA